MTDNKLDEWLGRSVGVKLVQLTDAETRTLFRCTLESADERGIVVSPQSGDDPSTQYRFFPWHKVEFIQLLVESQNPQGARSAGLDESRDQESPSVHLVGLQPIMGDHLEWQLTVPPTHQNQGVTIFFNLRATDDPLGALHHVAQYNEIAWLSPTTADFAEWILDLDELRRSYPDHFPMSWFAGRVRIPPAYRDTFTGSSPRTGIEFSFDSSTPKA
jgi:hypothetical protein